MVKIKTVQSPLVAFLLINLLSAVVHAKPTAIETKPAVTVENKTVAEAGPAELPKPVVMLKVNNKELTAQDYAAFLQRNQMYVRGAMESEKGKVEAIRAMVGSVLIKEVMMQEPGLLPQGEKSSPKEWSDAYEKVAAAHFPIPPVADEKTLYEYYQAHQNDFGLPEMIRLSQIQFRYPEKANEEVKRQAKDRAEKALKRLEAGEEFGKLAMELTENPMGKYPMGDLGFLVPSQSPWLKEAIKNLKVGEHTGIIDSPVGYEILMVTDTRAALTTPFANVRDKVIQAIQNELQTKSRDVYIKDLAAKAKIEIIQPELKALFQGGVF